MINVLNGGAHATNNVDFQEFMLFPIGAPTFAEALRFGAETFHTLKKLLQKRGLVTAVGDEGGFAPNLKTNTEAVEMVAQAIREAGYTPGKDIAIALDPAASEFFDTGNAVAHGRKPASTELAVRLSPSVTTPIGVRRTAETLQHVNALASQVLTIYRFTVRVYGVKPYLLNFDRSQFGFRQGRRSFTC